MKNLMIAPILTLASVILTYNGCRKEGVNYSTTAALDNSIAQSGFNDLHNVVIQEAAENGFAGFYSALSETGKMADGCATVTFSAPLGMYPNTMTVDFGTGCIGYLGIERSGKVIATFTGAYKETGTVITITTEGYHVNGNLVEGIKTITNTGENADGNIVFNIVVTDGKITLVDGSTIEWNAIREREWIEGDETAIISDDIYLISGASNGINRDDVAFSETITSDLRVEMDCRYIVAGTREIAPEGLDTRVVDYGEGACDNLISVTIAGTVYEIELPF